MRNQRILFFVVIALVGVMAVSGVGAAEQTDMVDGTLGEMPDAGGGASPAVSADTGHSGPPDAAFIGNSTVNSTSSRVKTTSTNLGSLDVVFVIDGSGTMDDDIQKVRASIKDFAAKVEQGNDVQYAIVWYSDATVGQTFTTDVNTLNQSLANRQGSSPEKSYEALSFALNDLNYRSNARTVVLQFTDEEVDEGSSSDPVDGQDVANMLQNRNVKYIGVAPPDADTADKDSYWPSNADLPYGADIANLAQAEGSWFDLYGGNLSEKFANEIAGEVANSSLEVNIRQINRKDFPEIKVYATVTNASGAPISGLTQSDFEIAEDGVNQYIQSVTQLGSGTGTDVSTALVIDRSGSMDNTPGKMESTEQAAKQFVDTLGPNDEALVMSFSSSPRIDQRWTADKTALKSVIDYTASGGTELYPSVIDSVDEATPRSGRSAVIVLTDGRANSPGKLGSAISKAQTQNVPVYTIGLGDQINETALQRLASETGGKYYKAPSQNDLQNIYQELSQRIANEYRITYTTTNTTTDGGTRFVDLTAYFAGKQGSDSGTYDAPCAPLPDAQFTYSVSSRTVQFDAGQSSGNGGSLVAYRWDFDNDGIVDARGQQVSYTFPTTKTYETKLTVAKQCGASDTETKTVSLSGNLRTSVSLTPTTQQIAPGEGTTVQVVVDNAQNGVRAYDLNVSVDDPSVAEITAIEPAGNPALVDTTVTPSEANIAVAADDTPDSGSVTIVNVTVVGKVAGSTGLGVTVDTLGNENNSVYTVTSTNGASLSVAQGPPAIEPRFNRPTDPDADGAFEDTNGDGSLNVIDVSVLFDNRNDPQVTGYSQYYDFNSDGAFNIVDIASLLDSLSQTTTSMNAAVNAANPQTSVSLKPTTQQVVPGDQTTVQVVVDSTQNGVRSYELNVSVDDPSVAAIQAVEFAGNPQFKDSTVTAGKASVAAAAADTQDSGSVTILNVTLVGMGTGTTGLDADVNALGNEDNTVYTVTSTNGASVSVGTGANMDVSLKPGQRTVAQGSTTPVTATVKNTGAASGTATVEFLVDGQVSSTKTVSLTAGDSTTLSFPFDAGTVAAGSHTVTVRTQNDHATTTIDVVVDPLILTFQQQSPSLGNGSTTTLTLAATNVSGGVGAYDLQFRMSDASVATIQNVNLHAKGSAATRNVTVAPDGSWARTKAALADTNDTGTVPILTLTLSGEAKGTTDLRMPYTSLGTESGVKYSSKIVRNATVTVTGSSVPTLPGGQSPPKDVDGDGKLEDLNGDGSFDIIDVQFLFANRNAPKVLNNVDQFDFNGDKSVDIIDVQALFAELQS